MTFPKNVLDQEFLIVKSHPTSSSLAKQFFSQSPQEILLESGKILQTEKKQVLILNPDSFDIHFMRQSNCDLYYFPNCNDKYEYIFCGNQYYENPYNHPHLLNIAADALRIKPDYFFKCLGEIDDYFYSETTKLVKEIYERNHYKQHIIAQEFDYYFLLHINYFLQRKLNVDSLVATLMKWFVDQINSNISKIKEHDEIILIDNNSSAQYFNRHAFKSYSAKHIKKTLEKDELIIYANKRFYSFPIEQLRQEIAITTNKFKQDDQIFGYELSDSVIQENPKIYIIGSDPFEAEFLENFLRRGFNLQVHNQVPKADIDKYYSLFIKNKASKYSNRWSQLRFYNLDVDRLHQVLKFMLPQQKDSVSDFLVKPLHYFINLSKKFYNNEVELTQFLCHMNREDYYSYLNALLYQLNLLYDLDIAKYIIALFLRTFTLWTGDYETFDIYLRFLSSICQYFPQDTINTWKFFVLDIFNSYKNLFPADDRRLEIEQKFLDEYRKLYKNVKPICRQDIYDIGNMLAITSPAIPDIWLSPFRDILQVPTRITWPAGDSILKYLDGRKDQLDIPNIFTNPSATALMLTKLLYEVSRSMVYQNYWYSNNVIIEMLIEFAENYIDFYMNQVEMFPQVYHRIISLLSAKNNLKIRYNLDNHLWNTLDLIEIYLVELQFIIDNNYYFDNIATVVKTIDELTKIQNYYNLYSPQKSCRKDLMRLISKLATAINSLFTDAHTIEPDYFQDKIFQDYELIDSNIEKYECYQNNLSVLLETSNSFLDPILFYSPNLIHLQGNKHTLEQQQKEFVDTWWNIFNPKKHPEIEDTRLYYSKNILKPDFVYDL